MAKLILKDEVLEGYLMPDEDPKFYFLKMPSGYNIGILKSKVVKIEPDKKNESKKLKITLPKANNKLKNISILNTGGTVSSKVDYTTGAVTAQFSPEEIISLYPEITEIANIKAIHVKSMMSDNMRFEHYNIMAKAVEKEIKLGADGVIIAHGTDTMHYSAAALSFALENVDIPIVLVGSQRSSDRPSSDSFLNLVSAAMFIDKSNFKGVYVCMHDNINDEEIAVLPGTKVRKMHTSRRDAFKAINASPIALVNYEKKSIKKLADENSVNGKFTLKLFNPNLKVGLLKLHPNFHPEELSVYEKFDGLLIELFALGQGPVVAQDSESKIHDKIAKELKKLASNIPVCGTSQCIYGRLDMNVYSEGRLMNELGVIGNYTDMTPETGYIKLAWLLSNHKKDVKSLYIKNLRGEISERLDNNSYL